MPRKPRNERDLPPTEFDRLRADLTDWKAIAEGLAEPLRQYYDTEMELANGRESDLDIDARNALAAHRALGGDDD